ncbi:MAG: AbrB/MazE/SpoVT family DNA-binding domain-containing protein [Fimbriimonadaceae bacterium]|nr:AbrB/MazE/SpoVT family DNA-binding domain-containing protein [Fimbriimonadaceae bacterium]QYK55840.1 MAG: AbrB/MazE/SpoVT family DNA-binding domain-containing protein [Fimbriimonadaceae bacterium]
MDLEKCFYGATTVGERGQIVIPAEARADLGIKAGDKLIVMRDPVVKGLMVAKIEAFQALLEEMTRKLEVAQQLEVEQ